MHWALYPRGFSLYGYDQPGGLEARAPYACVGQVELIGVETAWIYATLRNGAPLTHKDWRDVARLLKPKGVTSIMAERGGQIVTWSTDRLIR